MKITKRRQRGNLSDADKHGIDGAVVSSKCMFDRSTREEISVSTDNYEF